eukprot:13029478-Alexandrium_andersonii.AAC.1
MARGLARGRVARWRDAQLDEMGLGQAILSELSVWRASGYTREQTARFWRRGNCHDPLTAM